MKQQRELTVPRKELPASSVLKKMQDLQHAKDRRQALERKAQAKVQVLKDKAAEARARAS